MNLKNERTQLILGVAVSFGLFLAIGLGSSYAPEIPARLNASKTTTIGIVKDPALPINDYTLTDQNGKSFRLSALQGKYALVFFGFVNCPDVCPVTMVEFKRIKEALADKAGQIQFVMISLDGERDSPEVLKKYLATFDSEFIGLTSPPNLIRGVAADFGVQFEKQKLGSPGVIVSDDATKNYIIAHTPFSYLIDSEGRWISAYPFQSDPKLVAEEIKQQLDRTN